MSTINAFFKTGSRDFRVHVDSNAAEVAELMQKLGGQINKRARNAATRGALLQLRTRVLKTAASQTGVPQKFLRKRFYMKRRNPRALFIGTRPVSIIGLNARELTGGKRQRYGKGVSYAGAGGRKRLPHAFIAVGRRGNKHVFQRAGKERHPIEVQDVEIREPIERTARQLAGSFLPRKFEEIYAREFNFRTNREIERMRARTVTLQTR